MPINHRVYPHKRRPPRIRGIEMGELLSMGVCSSRAHKYGFDGWTIGQVCLQPFLHGQAVSVHIEVVFCAGRGDKVIDFGKRVGGYDIYGLQLIRDMR